MKQMLDSNQLHCFLSVFEHGSMTAAANVLGITQPALSKNLKRLETELGIELFQRTHFGMTPTNFGLTLARYARQMHLDSHTARNALQLMQEGGYGSIVIGIGPMWSVHSFPKVVSSIIKKYPKSHIKIVSGVLDTLLPLLLKGDLDIVISSLDFPDQPDLVKEKMFETEHIIVAHESHPLASRKNVKPENLIDYPFVGFTDDYAGVSRMENFFALHGLSCPDLAVESSSLEMMISLLSQGDFLASFSAPILRRSNHLGITRIDLPHSFWRFSVGAVYRARSQQSGQLQSILEIIRSGIKGMETDTP